MIAELKLALIAAAIVAALGGVVWWQTAEQAKGAARVQGLWDAQKAADSAALLAETQRLMKAQSEIANDAQKRIDAARASAASAAAAAGRLRQRLAAALSAGAGAASSPAGSPAASAGVLQPDVRGGIEDAARQLVDRAVGLAATADAAYSAGLTCQRDYDALTPVR